MDWLCVGLSFSLKIWWNNKKKVWDILSMCWHNLKYVKYVPFWVHLRTSINIVINNIEIDRCVCVCVRKILYDVRYMGICFPAKRTTWLNLTLCNSCVIWVLCKYVCVTKSIVFFTIALWWRTLSQHLAGCSCKEKKKFYLFCYWSFSRFEWW